MISNNLIRHIIIEGDICPQWNKEIIIYFESSNTIFFHSINKIVEFLELEKIRIVEKNKNFIKFVLNILDKEYFYIIKERDPINKYKYFFEINQLEYDIKSSIIINNLSNKMYNIGDEYILKLRKLDLLSDLEIKTQGNDKIINFLANNPLVICELIELMICFSNFFTVIEINNLLINLNDSLEKNNILIKTIKNILNNDEELFLYKELIKFSYNLEEKGLFSIYIKYIIDEYYNFINLLCNIEIDIELLKMFEIEYIKEFICLLIFQHLIYNKSKIFKNKSNHKNDDLLDTFMKEYINTDSDNELIENNNTNDFNMLDKYKFSSLKYLKETSKSFNKFEDLLKLVTLIDL
jgi:hypothetical protein